MWVYWEEMQAIYVLFCCIYLLGRLEGALVPDGTIIKFSSTALTDKGEAFAITTTYYVSDSVVVAQLGDKNSYLVYRASKRPANSSDASQGSRYTLILDKTRSGRCISGDKTTFRQCGTVDGSSSTAVSFCPKGDNDTCI